MDLAVANGSNEGVLLLIASAAALYGAARLALFALARPDGTDTGRRALGQWVPMASAAVGAIILRQPEVAVAIILVTSIASLTLVPGLITLMTPLEARSAGRRAWPFVLPAALLPFMAGFTGGLGWGHAVTMLILGAVLVLIWREGKESASDPGTGPSAARVPDQENSPLNPPIEGAYQRPRDAYAALLILTCLILAALGSYLGVRGAAEAAKQSQFLSPGLVAAVIFSPLLLLPTIGTASAVAQHGHVDDAMTALFGTALLNLCLLLPVVILLYGLQQASMKPIEAGTAQTIFQRIVYPPLPYAFSAWRIDNVLLVVLGFGWIPVAAGRLRIGRLESVFLVAGFLIYLIAQAILVMPIPSGQH